MMLRSRAFATLVLAMALGGCVAPPPMKLPPQEAAAPVPAGRAVVYVYHRDPDEGSSAWPLEARVTVDTVRAGVLRRNGYLRLELAPGRRLLGIDFGSRPYARTTLVLAAEDVRFVRLSRKVESRTGGAWLDTTSVERSSFAEIPRQQALDELGVTGAAASSPSARR
jgi:hypothetical protein